MTAYDGKTSPSEVPIVILPMWARIFDLPLPMMDDIFGREVGKKLGAVRMVHTDNKGRAFDDFLRVRIEHIVSKPLRKWIVIEDISDPERKKKRCPVKYERVPHFCFFCGFIGHTQSSCLIPEEEKIVHFSTEQRASPYKMFEHRSFYMPGEQSKAKRNLQFKSPSPSGWKCVPQDDSRNGSHPRNVAKVPGRKDGIPNSTDEERTTTDPLIAQVVKDVVDAVNNLDIVAGKTEMSKQMGEFQSSVPGQLAAKKGTWTRYGRPEQSGQQRRGPSRSLTQTARRNPSVGQVAAALSAGIAARKAALLSQRRK